jgi:aspartyl-tRNA(Asn)/glutamyl-tRNA(Gln) amidotransferase subunit C
MKLTEEEIQKLAHLSRLHLSPEEAARYATDLTEILSYVGLLSELNTEGVAETAQVTGLANVSMPDKIEPLTPPEELLKLSPLPLKKGQIRINRMM